MLTRDAVKAQARELGFDLCGIAPRAIAIRELARLATWIARGYAGEMTYLAESLDERRDPARVLPTARSVISLAVVYNTDQPYSTTRRRAGPRRRSRATRGATTTTT